MRNRMIKAEFWADRKVASCSFIARLLFIGSWNFADDTGVCRADSVYLRNNIFPYDSVSISEINKALEQLNQKDLIRFGEFNDEEYFLIVNFLKHQLINRPSKQRYVNADYKLVFAKHSVSTHGLFSEYSLLKGKGKEKENTPPTPSKKEEREGEGENFRPFSSEEIENSIRKAKEKKNAEPIGSPEAIDTG